MMHEAPPPSLVSSPPVIRRLSTRLINQIAAGEVVTRASAAIKELVENSLDAGAGRIEIAVEEDVRSFSVRDDGVGMDQANLALSIERYATSKIQELDDLQRLTTRGFRGEALAALAAVSRLEILTRQPHAPEGLRLKCSGGKEPSIHPAAANPGTTITVRDLFYNVPARLKFLKSPVAEWGRILQTLVRQALTRPDVAFAIRWKNKPYLNLPAGQPLRERLAQILPAEVAGDLIEIDHTLHEVRVWGAVSGPRSTRRDRRHQYFFVNERPIVFRPLPFALEEAFKGLIMTQRFPVGALLIEMPGAMVDVNVHPTKEEVRFENESLVTGAVHRAVLEALRGAELVPTLHVGMPGGDGHVAGGGLKIHTGAPANSGGPTLPTAGPGGGFTLQGGTINTTPSTPLGQPAGGQLDFVPGFGLPGAQAGGANAGAPYGEGATASLASGAPAAPQAPPYEDENARQEAGLIQRLRATLGRPRALAQVALTYILAEAGPQGMLVIDQHAAHEKILYLQFMAQMERPGGLQIQPLLIPHSVEVAPAEAAALDELLPALASAGFEVEPFGGQSYVIQSMPVLFERLDVPGFIRDLIDDVGQGNLGKQMHRLHDKICARAACRAAVKSGDPLTPQEQQRLVDDLMVTADAMRCPHGRPTVMLLTRDDLDRQFGRLG